MQNDSKQVKNITTYEENRSVYDFFANNNISTSTEKRYREKITIDLSHQNGNDVSLRSGKAIYISHMEKIILFSSGDISKPITGNFGPLP